jgi:hypothetical protein
LHYKKEAAAALILTTNLHHCTWAQFERGVQHQSCELHEHPLVQLLFQTILQLLSHSLCILCQQPEIMQDLPAVVFLVSANVQFK